MLRDIKTLDEEELAREVGIAVGTRPGIVMMSPIIHEVRRRGLPHFVIHTGQHYSPNMDAQFFADLDLPPPDHRLTGVAEKRTHGGQTAAMLEGVEAVLLRRRPRLFLVCGDANTNLASALAARKLHIGVGHVEAGERSNDWRMPEEHNRRIIDHISDHLFATGERSVRNLRRESVHGQIHLVGNPIVDASRRHLDLARRHSQALQRCGVEPGRYALLTTHREENVDVLPQLRGALEGVSLAAEALRLPVLFPAHPRTQKRLQEFRLDDWLAALPRVQMVDAVGYLDFLALLAGAALVFTDFGRGAAGGLHPAGSLRDAARQYRMGRDAGGRRQPAHRLRSRADRRRRAAGDGERARLGGAVRRRHRGAADRRHLRTGPRVAGDAAASHHRYRSRHRRCGCDPLGAGVARVGGAGAGRGRRQRAARGDRA